MELKQDWELPQEHNRYLLKSVDLLGEVES